MPSDARIGTSNQAVLQQSEGAPPAGAKNSCVLNLTPFADTPSVCDHCGAPLKGRRKRWCSTAHSYVVFDAHDWGQARKNAKIRDGHRCVTCGATALSSGKPLEVNHIEPRVGQGYGMGCWNHLDNLETLCHDCHVQITNEQRRARKAQTVTTKLEQPALFS